MGGVVWEIKLGASKKGLFATKKVGIVISVIVALRLRQNVMKIARKKASKK